MEMFPQGGRHRLKGNPEKIHDWFHEEYLQAILDNNSVLVGTAKCHPVVLLYPPVILQEGRSSFSRDDFCDVFLPKMRAAKCDIIIMSPGGAGIPKSSSSIYSMFFGPNTVQ